MTSNWSLCTSGSIINVRVVIREPKQRLSRSDAVNESELFRTSLQVPYFREYATRIQASYINDFPENLGKTTVKECKKSTSVDVRCSNRINWRTFGTAVATRTLKRLKTGLHFFAVNVGLSREREVLFNDDFAAVAVVFAKASRRKGRIMERCESYYSTKRDIYLKVTQQS